MKRLLLNTLLLLIAKISAFILFPIANIFTFVYILIHNRKHFFKEVNKYISNIQYAKAYNKDKTANTVFSFYLNKYFITSDSKYRFGCSDHSISLVIGYNYRENTLLKQGLWWRNFLEKKDKGHCENAIKDYENINFD